MPPRLRRGAVLAAWLLGGTSALPAAAQPGGWDLSQQAADACERALTLQMGTESGARDAQARVDSPSMSMRQGRNDMTFRGSGSFRRDRFDRGRAFTFDCTVNLHNGAARANYHWGNSNWGGGYNEPGYTAPPAYRPSPSGGWGGGGGTTSYPPTGRVFYSGAIVNRASGKGLDVQDRSTRDAANVQQWDFGANPNQSWDVVDQGGGLFSIVSQGSGKALDVANHGATDGANIQQFRFHNGDNQLWRLERVSGGFYQIVSVSSGRCLDVDLGRINENGANVQQWSCSGQPNQQWRLGSR
jgi:hypothetical protein